MKRGRERGAVAAEFAFVFLLFITLVTAVMEFARLMMVYVSAVEATRYGARLAIVCGVDAQSAIKARMKKRLTLLQPANISIHYPSTVCRASSCDGVTVAVSGLNFRLSIPLLNIQFPIPSYSTSLPSESAQSTGNAACS